MNRRVLFVDDEQAVLQGIRRNLHKDFHIESATDPRSALEMIDTQEPFAVIVSDMRMPGMDGIEFLYQARKLSPYSVRLMLTGNDEQSTAIRAVNRGDVFKFLTKPCDAAVLRKVVELSVRQYELTKAEKDVLEETVRGSVTALAEILAIAHPMAFGRVERLRRLARVVAERVEDADSWEVDTAVLLSHIGCVATPAAILEKASSGRALEDAERVEYSRHPMLGAELVRKIPRLEGVARAILYQLKNHDGSGVPDDDVAGDGIPLSARILRAVFRYDELRSGGKSDAGALEAMVERRAEFDERVLQALAAGTGESIGGAVAVATDELRQGMIIEQDVSTEDGVLLVCRGQVVTATLRRHLENFHASGRLPGHILVSSPAVSISLPESRIYEP